MKNLLKFTDFNLKENIDDELDDMLTGFEVLGINPKPGPKDLYFKGKWVSDDSIELEVEGPDYDGFFKFWITNAKYLNGEDLTLSELKEFDEKFAQKVFDDRYE